MRVPDATDPRGYRHESDLIGRKWTKGGRPPAGYVTARMAEDALRERIVDARRQAGERWARVPMPTIASVAAE